MHLPETQLPVFSPSDLKDIKQIAQGTTSVVSVASLHTLTVAVKTLKPLSEIREPLTRQRAPQDFRNELAINARLRHPNILLFIGCIRVDELQGLIFEYCPDGVAKCSNYGLTRIPQAVQLCLGVGRALCFAHQLGILHRDVKPSQVLMFEDAPKLGDWGLATFPPEGGCHSGETGTWEFMAPEVIRSERYDLSADVFSFGMLVYCFVTGISYPYQDNFFTPAQAAIGVAKKDLRPHLSSRIPEVVSHVITSCWEADPKARPAMVDVVEMLQKAEGLINSKSKGSSQGWGSWIWGS